MAANGHNRKNKLQKIQFFFLIARNYKIFDLWNAERKAIFSCEVEKSLHLELVVWQEKKIEIK